MPKQTRKYILGGKPAQSKTWYDREAKFSNMILGQEGIAERIFPRIKMFEANLNPENRPVGSFMLAGPTGVGKTRTVECVAELLHGSTKNMLRIDCGEYQMEHEVAKLVGAPPGYLGHRETAPALTQARLNGVTSEHSNLSVVLFDEIEKAANSMINILLGILDNGLLTTGGNEKVDFSRSIIFITTNEGSSEISKRIGGGVGFVSSDSVEAIEKMSISAIRRSKKFSSEFIGRMDDIIPYKPISRETAKKILHLEIEKANAFILRRTMPTKPHTAIELDNDAVEKLLDIGYDEKLGARGIRRAVENNIIFGLSEGYLSGQLLPSKKATVTVVDGELAFSND